MAVRSMDGMCLVLVMPTQKKRMTRMSCYTVQCHVLAIAFKFDCNFPRLKASSASGRELDVGP